MPKLPVCAEDSFMLRIKAIHTVTRACVSRHVLRREWWLASVDGTPYTIAKEYLGAAGESLP